jgi:hypothetical protein
MAARDIDSRAWLSLSLCFGRITEWIVDHLDAAFEQPFLRLFGAFWREVVPVALLGLSCPEDIYFGRSVLEFGGEVPQKWRRFTLNRLWPVLCRKHQALR